MQKFVFGANLNALNRRSGLGYKIDVRNRGFLKRELEFFFHVRNIDLLPEAK